jgi:hypothetical protein
MLREISEINDFTVVAIDGRLGRVTDFLFDDLTWLVRWLVVDTGNWLSGRKVLLPPAVLTKIDPKGREFSVNLTKQQVKGSPDIDFYPPVTRQMEANIYDYYGWSPYWGTGFTMGAAVTAPADLRFRRGLPDDVDPHLLGTEGVTGYHIRASDGEIGHVEDFIVEDADWSLHALIVDTRNWWPGQKVLVSPCLVHKVDWIDSVVVLDIDRQSVKDSPGHEAFAIVEQAIDKFYDVSYGDGPSGDQI